MACTYSTRGKCAHAVVWTGRNRTLSLAALVMMVQPGMAETCSVARSNSSGWARSRVWGENARNAGTLTEAVLD